MEVTDPRDRIDWSVFSRWPENEVTCACGAVFRSYTKMVRWIDGRIRNVSQKPCPACGSDFDAKRISSPPESIIRGSI